MYASSSTTQPYISVQDKLRIWTFAVKHELTIEEVELMLERL